MVAGRKMKKRMWREQEGVKKEGPIKMNNDDGKELRVQGRKEKKKGRERPDLESRQS